MAHVHPNAVVDPQAELAEGVEVLPFAVIRGRVRIGAGTVVHPHTVVEGNTLIGEHCRLGPAAYVGLDPQHKAYRGEPTWLTVGDRTVVREGASLHRATAEGVDNATRVGADCFIMGGAHVAHDCRIGDDVTLANGVLLGGHVEIGPQAFLGGGSVVHQFARIGRLALVGGNEAVARDVPPFAAMRYGGLKGYNAVGCRRAGMDRGTIHLIRQMFHVLHTTRSPFAAARIIASMDHGAQAAPAVREMLDFIRASRRGLMPSLKFSRAAVTAHADEVAAE